MKNDLNKSKQVIDRLAMIADLEEEVSMSQSGGDVKWNPVVLAVVELIVVSGT